MDGPSPGSGLGTLIPSGVEIRSVEVVNMEARIDLSAAFLVNNKDQDLARTAVLETMIGLPGVSSVSVAVEGKPLGQSAQRIPLLFYAGPKGLVAVPAEVSEPRAAISAYLADLPDPKLTGLPRDVRLLNYAHDPDSGALSLNFTYMPSVRALALDQPAKMRSVLLGLIASLTEFPQVRTVRIDFEGQTRLGIGQCSDLLRTPQRRPELLNDERLLGW
jgi:spore germination protein GerM